MSALQRVWFHVECSTSDYLFSTLSIFPHLPSIVQSNIFLMSTQDSLSTSLSSPDFVINATSSKAPVSLAVRHEMASVLSRFAVLASSIYAPVAVSLDALYEGSFSITSDVGVGLVRDDLPDPTGMSLSLLLL